jgi:hypothetical protein
MGQGERWTPNEDLLLPDQMSAVHGTTEKSLKNQWLSHVSRQMTDDGTELIHVHCSPF